MTFFTLPITVTKLDYFGQPYEATVFPRKHFDYGAALKRHKELLEQEVEIRKGNDVRTFNSQASTNHHINLLHESER